LTFYLRNLYEGGRSADSRMTDPLFDLMGTLAFPISITVLRLAGYLPFKEFF
jgi:hypothetical protein